MTPGEMADRLEALGKLPHNIELAPAAAAMLRELAAENERLQAALDNLYADTIPIEEFEEVERP